VCKQNSTYTGCSTAGVLTFCKHKHLHVYIHIHTNIHPNMYICTYSYVHLCVYMHIHVYTNNMNTHIQYKYTHAWCNTEGVSLLSDIYVRWQIHTPTDIYSNIYVYIYKWHIHTYIYIIHKHIPGAAQRASCQSRLPLPAARAWLPAISSALGHKETCQKTFVHLKRDWYVRNISKDIFTFETRFLRKKHIKRHFHIWNETGT